VNAGKYSTTLVANLFEFLSHLTQGLARQDRIIAMVTMRWIVTTKIVACWFCVKKTSST
jgi:hypothetical protein